MSEFQVVEVLRPTLQITVMYEKEKGTYSQRSKGRKSKEMQKKKLAKWNIQIHTNKRNDDDRKKKLDVRISENHLVKKRNKKMTNGVESNLALVQKSVPQGSILYISYV